MPFKYSYTFEKSKVKARRYNVSLTVKLTKTDIKWLLAQKWKEIEKTGPAGAGNPLR